MERNSKKLLRRLKDEGWSVERVKGDHFTLKHPDRAELITITHPKKDLPIGLVRMIYRTTGWKT